MGHRPTDQPEVDPLGPGEPDRLHRLGDQAQPPAKGSEVGGQDQWCTLYMEFWAAAMRNPSLRPRFAAQYRALHAGTAQMIQTQADALGISLDTQAEELAGTLIAVFEGYVLQKLIDPQLLPADFFARLLVRFFGRLAELERHQQPSQPPTHPPAR
jgi:BetI-type transcriptional repressor, C-terminal